MLESKLPAHVWDLARRDFLEDRLRTDPKRATAVFEAEIVSAGGPAALARAGGTEILFDAPAWGGGAGRGVQPVEALLAALGAEIVAGLTLAAARAGAPLGGVSVHVEGGVDLARTAGIVDRRPVIDLVQIEVARDSAADAAHLADWLREAVDRSAIAGLFAAAGGPVQARLVETAGGGVIDV